MGNLVSQDLEGSYNKLCKELLENNPRHQDGCLHWASQTFKSDKLTHFIDCLGKNTCLKRLVLRDLDGLEDAPSLAKAIQQHPTLVCLGFNGRLLKQDFQVFADAFLESPTLTELEIENSIVPANTIDGVITILTKSPKAKATSLALKGCQVDASLLDRFTDVLASSATATTLEKLEITLKPPVQAMESAKNLNLFFQAKDSVLTKVKFAGFLQNALPSLLEGAKGHPVLKHITLEGKGVNDEDSTEELAQLLLEAPPSLEVLDLSNCYLTSDGVTRLAEVMLKSKSASLKELYFSHNSLANEGVLALSKVLEDPASKYRETLQVLDLRMNQIGSEGIAALCRALETSPPALQRLFIGEEAPRPNPSRQFVSNDIQALVEMLQKNSFLRDLNLEDASFDDEDLLNNFLDALGKNKTFLKGLRVAVRTTKELQAIADKISALHLERLHVKVMDGAEFDEATAKALLGSLEKNDSLHDLVLSDMKGPNAAVWKSFEPKIKHLLAQRTGNGVKRSLVDSSNGEANNDSKRSKSSDL